MRTAKDNGRSGHSRGGSVPSDSELFAEAAVTAPVAPREPRRGLTEMPGDSGNLTREHLVSPIEEKGEAFLEMTLRKEAKNLEEKNKFYPYFTPYINFQNYHMHNAEV